MKLVGGKKQTQKNLAQNYNFNILNRIWVTNCFQPLDLVFKPGRTAMLAHYDCSVLMSTCDKKPQNLYTNDLRKVLLYF